MNEPGRHSARPTCAANGNRLVYALWAAGLVGAAAILLQRWDNPIASRDFAFFWVAGKLAASGHAAQAYDVNAIRTAAASYGAFGQTGLFYGALWLWCFSGSAVAAALLTVKPQLGLLAAVEAMRARFLIRAGAIAIVILALSVLVFGLGTWRAFLEGAATNHLKMIGAIRYPNWYVQMTTPYLGYGLMGWLAFAAAAIFLLVRRFNAFTAATATFLISPYGFHYDMTVVCLGFGTALFRK